MQTATADFVNFFIIANPGPRALKPATRILRRLALALGIAGAALAAAAPPDYLQFGLTPPAGVPPLAGPEAICFDRPHQELYVADAGNSRILIFDHSGSYLFEFSDPERLTAPRAIDVDSSGRIYVLAARPDDRIQIFDYDGTFLQDWPLTGPQGDSAISAANFVLGGGRLFALDGEAARVYVYTLAGGALETSFSLLDSTDKPGDSPVIGRLAWIADRLVVPMPMFAQVQIHTADGTREKVFGVLGGTPGSFSFPIAATADASGGMLVLDKHRHTVLQFTRTGSFVREFGGMGVSPGWFYHPQAICTDGAGRYYVAQTFLNRVQAVRVPGEALPPEVRVSVATPAAAGLTTP